MSTKMYAFRAESDRDLREQVGVIKFLVLTSKAVEGYRLDGIELQVFRTSFGIVYRVLEDGWGIRNKMYEHKELFPTCNYDSRGEIAEDEVGNEKIAEQIDEMITNKQYSIIKIM